MDEQARQLQVQEQVRVRTDQDRQRQQQDQDRQRQQQVQDRLSVQAPLARPPDEPEPLDEPEPPDEPAAVYERVEERGRDQNLSDNPIVEARAADERAADERATAERIERERRDDAEALLRNYTQATEERNTETRAADERATAERIERERRDDAEALLRHGMPQNPRDHHIFPQNESMKAWFADPRRNIDVHEHTATIEREKHDEIHGADGQRWNKQWETFIDNNPGASRRQVENQAAKMMENAQIEDAWLHRYREFRPFYEKDE